MSIDTGERYMPAGARADFVDPDLDVPDMEDGREEHDDELDRGDTEPYSVYGDVLDWAEAQQTGFHLIGSAVLAPLGGDGYYNLKNGARRTTYLGGALRAGHDLRSLD